MMTLPLVLRGDARPFVIIGGGPVAARKAATLVQAGASVAVISPKVTTDIQKLADDGRIQLELRPASTDESFPAVRESCGWYCHDDP